MGKARTRQNFKIAREANLVLARRQVRPVEINHQENPIQKHWSAIASAHQKIGKIAESLLVVWLYNEVRTYFERNY